MFVFVDVTIFEFVIFSVPQFVC